MTVLRVNRTRNGGRVAWPGGSSDPRLCGDCKQQRHEQEQRQRAAWASEREQWSQVRDRELEDLLRAIDAGASPTAVYVEYSGVPGTWRLADDGRVGRS